jgi:hypothetical protein
MLLRSQPNDLSNMPSLSLSGGAAPSAGALKDAAVVPVTDDMLAATRTGSTGTRSGTGILKSSSLLAKAVPGAVGANNPIALGVGVGVGVGVGAGTGVSSFAALVTAATGAGATRVPALHLPGSRGVGVPGPVIDAASTAADAIMRAKKRRDEARKAQELITSAFETKEAVGPTDRLRAQTTKPVTTLLPPVPSLLELPPHLAENKYAVEHHALKEQQFRQELKELRQKQRIAMGLPKVSVAARASDTAKSSLCFTLLHCQCVSRIM